MTAFRYSRNLHEAEIPVLLEPVLARYGETTPPSLASGLTLVLDSPVSALSILERDPRRGSVDPLWMASRISLALQTALRTWLPPVWFADRERYNDFDIAAAIFGYSFSRPYTPKSRDTFNFDVLKNESQILLRESIARGLSRRLAPLERMLAAMDMPIAREYSPRRIEVFTRAYERNWHWVKRLLVAERMIVESCIYGYCGANPEKASQKVRHGIRRMFAVEDVSALESLIQIEAARGAERAADRDLAVRVKILANSSSSAALPPHAIGPSRYPQLGLLPVCLV